MNISDERISVLQSSLLLPEMGIANKFPSKLKRPTRRLSTSPSSNTFENSDSILSPVLSPFSPTVACPHNIRVVARIRPLSASEVDKGFQSKIHANSSIDSRHDEENRDPLVENTRDLGKGNTKPKTNLVTIDSPVSEGGREFEFDSVVGGDATQAEVYYNTVGDAIRQTVFSGFNFTILAYGQTSSGKTYTMLGEGEENSVTRLSSSRRKIQQPSPSAKKYELTETDGILPRVVFDLFQAKEECDGKVNISMSFLELYNDELIDLFNDECNSSLKLKDHGANGVQIDGLSVKTVEAPVEAMELMKAATKRRVVGASALNAVSSRSHAICMMNVTIRYDGSNAVQAKLTLVDLAGSERLKKTGSEGIQKQEGININKDLFVLGNVISALAAKGYHRKLRRNSKSIHIPYRNSKLTQILRDALGGNSYTVMVACISPACDNVEESVNTLRYASRTRAIKNSLTQNAALTTTSSKHVDDSELRRLRQENAALRSQLAELSHLPLVQNASQESTERSALQIPGAPKLLNHNCDEYNMFSPLLSDQDYWSELSSDFGIPIEARDESFNARSELVACSGSICIKPQNGDAHHAWEHLIKIKKDIDAQIADAVLRRDSLLVEIVSLSSQVEVLSKEKEALVALAEERMLELKFLSEEEIRIQHRHQLLTVEGDCWLDKVNAQSNVREIVSQLTEERELRKRCEDEMERLKTIVHNLNYVLSAEESRYRDQNKLLEEERNFLLQEVNSSSGVAKISSELAEERESRKRCEEEINQYIITVQNLHREKGDLLSKIAVLESKPTHEGKASSSTYQLTPLVQSSEEQAIQKSSRPPRHPSCTNGSPIDFDTLSKGSVTRKKSGASTKEHSSDFANKLIRIEAAKLLHKASQQVTVGRHHGNKSIATAASIESLHTSRSRSGFTQGSGCSMTFVEQQQDPEHVEFFLPKFDFSCGCEDCQQCLRKKSCHPILVSDVLRPWQTEFLASLGISTLQELTCAADTNSRGICKAMVVWRAQHRLKLVNRKSCKIALHIWSRTASVIIKKAGSMEQNERTLNEICMFDDNASVSTLGCPDELEV